MVNYDISMQIHPYRYHKLLCHGQSVAFWHAPTPCWHVQEPGLFPSPKSCKWCQCWKCREGWDRLRSNRNLSEVHKNPSFCYCSKDILVVFQVHLKSQIIFKVRPLFHDTVWLTIYNSANLFYLLSIREDNHQKWLASLDRFLLCRESTWFLWWDMDGQRWIWQRILTHFRLIVRFALYCYTLQQMNQEQVEIVCLALLTSSC